MSGFSSDNRYRTWNAMRGRCYRPCMNGYRNYGGKGITVCDRWNILGGEGFKNFCEDMGLRPSMRHTLDRLDGTKGYSKENCQWLPWNDNSVKRKLFRNLGTEPLGGRNTIRRTLLSVGLRHCSVCKKVDWIENFTKDKNLSSGYSSRCKLCVCAYFKNYYLNINRKNRQKHLTVASDSGTNKVQGQMISSRIDSLDKEAQDDCADSAGELLGRT